MTRPDTLTVTTGTTSVLEGAGAVTTAAFFTVVFFFATFFLTAFLTIVFFLATFFLATFFLATFFLVTFFLVAFFLIGFFLTTFFATGFFVALGADVAECAIGSEVAVRENTEMTMAALESNFFTPPLSRVHPRILGITRAIRLEIYFDLI